jgi:hypothetical protein
MRDRSINTIRLIIQPYRESKRIIPRPHPPPARAVRPRPSRFGARVGPSDSSLPPAPPAGGMITLHTPSAQKQNTAAKFARGHSLRSVTLRYERARLLITLRSIESREPPFAARAYAGAPSLEAPMLRCSSLGASSLVAPMLRPSSLGDSLPSISLTIDATAENWILPYIPQAHNSTPPPAPCSRRPSSPLALWRSGRSVRQLAAPRPARGGLNYPAYPKRTKAEYSGKVRSRVSVRLRSPLRCSPLRKEPSRHALAHYRPLARLEAAPFSAPLLSASKGAAPPRASLFILPSSSAGTRGPPRTPLAPRLRRSARACCAIMRVYDK